MLGWIKLVAVIHGLSALAVAALGVALLVVSLQSAEPAVGGLILPVLFGALAALLGGLAWGTWRHRPWARRPTLILAVVGILSGAGFLASLIMLYTMLHPEVKRIFAR